jgi:hypothetical protein
MTDPATLIVIALRQALIAFAQQVGEEAAHDAYTTLKTTLAGKYPQAKQYISTLESNPQSDHCIDRMVTALRGWGAQNDVELSRLAGRLLDIISYAFQKDSTDRFMRDGGVYAVSKILYDQAQRDCGIRDHFRVSDTDLLSSNIMRASEIPAHLRQEISSLHSRVRQVIEAVAWDTQNAKYGHVESMARALPGRMQRENAAAIVQADKKINISYETLRITVDTFGKLNQQILDELEKINGGSSADSAKRENELMFINAVIVYELTDFVTDFIENFTPGGFSELRELHRATMQRVERRLEKDRSLVDQVNNNEINPEVRAQTLRDVDMREKGFRHIQDAWQSYLEDMKKFYNDADGVKLNLPTLKIIKANAESQIDFLEISTVVRFLKDSASAIRASVDVLKGSGLAPLTPERVLRLLEPSSDSA